MFLSKRYNPSAISLFLSLDFIFVYFLFYLEMLICYILNSYFVYPIIKLTYSSFITLKIWFSGS